MRGSSFFLRLTNLVNSFELNPSMDEVSTAEAVVPAAKSRILKPPTWKVNGLIVRYCIS